MSSKKIKEHLLLSCEQQIMQKYIIVQDKIKSIVASLDDDTKSSAGDKHQTARAMLQLDREQAGERLVEIEKTLEVLFTKSILQKQQLHAHLGSLVTTNKGLFFLSISLGVVTHQKTLTIVLAYKHQLANCYLENKLGTLFVLEKLPIN